MDTTRHDPTAATFDPGRALRPLPDSASRSTACPSASGSAGTPGADAGALAAGDRQAGPGRRRRRSATRPTTPRPKMHAGIFPPSSSKVIEETEDFIISRDERGITKRDRRDGASMPEFLDYPVKTADDWERLKAERLALDAPGRIAQDWDAFRARLAQRGRGRAGGRLSLRRLRHAARSAGRRGAAGRLLRRARRWSAT